MAKEIEYAVKEAYQMQLNREQSIQFVMNQAKCNRSTATEAVQTYVTAMYMSH